jgi:hypothetical protein
MINIYIVYLDIQLNGANNSPRSSKGLLMTSFNKEDDNLEATKGETTKCTVISAVDKVDYKQSQESLHRSHRNLLSVQVNEKYLQAQNAHTKEITKMLFIVTVVFILAFLPHLILMLMNAIYPQSLRELSPAGVVAYTFFLRTFVINNMANPVVYFVCLGTFRSMCAEKFGKICCCLKR